MLTLSLKKIAHLGKLTFVLIPLVSCSGANFWGSSASQSNQVSQQGGQAGDGLAAPNSPESKYAQTGSQQDDRTTDWAQIGGWDGGAFEVDRSDKGLNMEQTTKKSDQSQPGPGVCARNWGQTPDGTHITGQGQKQDLIFTDSHSLKITGSGHELGAQLVSAQKLDHLCVFISGDLNRLKLKLMANVSIVYLFTTGTQSEIAIDVGKDKKVDLINVLMSGSQGVISVGGEGAHQCVVTTKGQNNTANCKI